MNPMLTSAPAIDTQGPGVQATVAVTPEVNGRASEPAHALVEATWEYHLSGGGQEICGVAGVSVFGRLGADRAVFWSDGGSGARVILAEYVAASRASVNGDHDPGTHVHLAQFEEQRSADGRLSSVDICCGSEWVLRLSIGARFGEAGGWARSGLPALLGLGGGQYRLRSVDVVAVG